VVARTADRQVAAGYMVIYRPGEGGEGPRVGSGLLRLRRGMNERWWKAIREDRLYRISCAVYIGILG